MNLRSENSRICFRSSSRALLLLTLNRNFRVTPGSQSASGRMRKGSGSSEPTRWDKYSGEPTTATTGLPGQVKPGTPLVALKSTGRLQQTDPGLVIDTRPPWKGASGRHAIVEPVKDKERKPGEAIPVPRRSSKRKPIPATSPSNATPSGIRVVDTEGETSPASVRESTPIADETIKPDPADRRSIPRKSIDTTYARQSSRENPDSRFSWTTYNTDTTYQQSPPSSPLPPMPALPVQPVSAAPANPYSIMNRSRPVPSSGSSPSPAPSPTIDTARKPVPSSTYDAPRHSPTSSLAPSTASKALPRTPQESSASDLVAALQAQLDDLFTQRSNVQKVIRDFLDTQPQNPLVSDLKARREAERKLENLKDDLAEITRLEHEVGLRLHRAYKKREKADGATPTALWIRRVTS